MVKQAVKKKLVHLLTASSCWAILGTACKQVIHGNFLETWILAFVISATEMYSFYTY